MVEGAAERAYRRADRVGVWRHHAAHLLAALLACLVWAAVLGGTDEDEDSAEAVGPAATLITLFLLYALAVAACAGLRSPVPRSWTALLNGGRRPGVQSVTWPVRRRKVTARAGMVVQVAGLVVALSAPVSRWPIGPVQAAVGVAVVAGVRFWPWWVDRRRRDGHRPERGRWRRAGWRVELGERRLFAPMTLTVGALSAERSVPVLPRTVDVRLVWAGTVAAAGAGFVLLAAAARLATMERAVLLAGCAFLLLYAAYRLNRLSQRIALPAAAESMRRDPRPPVLLLRAFAEDATLVRAAVSARRPLLERLSPLRSVRFEEALARRLDEFGPVIAVAAPGTTLPLLGAAGEATGGDRWTELVSGWMRRAGMIVVVAAPRRITPGLRWELDAITSLGAWSRTVLVLPPVARAETRLRWATFDPVLGAALGRRVQLGTDPAAAVAAVVRADGMRTVVAAEKSEWSYPAAVRAAVAQLAPSVDQPGPLPPPPAAPGAGAARLPLPGGDRGSGSQPPGQWASAGAPQAPSRPPPLLDSLRSASRGGPRQVDASSVEFQAAWAANLTVIALVVGMIGLMIWPLGIVALLAGRRRLRMLNEAPYPLPGRGAAVAAVVLGAIGTALTCLAAVLVLTVLVVALRG